MQSAVNVGVGYWPRDFSGKIERTLHAHSDVLQFWKISKLEAGSLQIQLGPAQSPIVTSVCCQSKTTSRHGHIAKTDFIAADAERSSCAVDRIAAHGALGHADATVATRLGDSSRQLEPARNLARNRKIISQKRCQFPAIHVLHP